LLKKKRNKKPNSCPVIRINLGKKFAEDIMEEEKENIKDVDIG